jgi:hypothetical protein
MAETRIQTVKDLASSRFDWEQALRDISRAYPKRARELHPYAGGDDNEFKEVTIQR